MSQHKRRLPGFSRQRCYDNLLKTADFKRVDITFLLDTFYLSPTIHFIEKQNRFRVIKIKEGSETGSFLRLIDHVISLDLDPDTIVYFLEDDYLHRPGWVDILLEGFTIPEAAYITLYDHPDKYDPSQYPNLQSKLFCTTSCHWRTTPSTTNSYAMRYGTLCQHLSVHQQFSQGRRITSDHEKFLELGRLGAQLISPIPGWSTHIEARLTSPCHDWESFFKKTEAVLS